MVPVGGGATMVEEGCYRRRPLLLQGAAAIATMALPHFYKGQRLAAVAAMARLCCYKGQSELLPWHSHVAARGGRHCYHGTGE
jgi:hypothetical protein